MVESGARVLLLAADGKKFIVRAAEGMLKAGDAGVFDGGKLLGAEWGGKVELAGREYTVLQPTLGDKLQFLDRRAQIIHLKDSALMALTCDVKAGDRVVEGGSGTGALTTVLAHCVFPDGKVYSYDVRKDHLKTASANLRNAGLDGMVEFKLGDLTERMDETGVDAVVLDVPEPWGAVGPARGALKAGGSLASYSPSVNQMERMVRALRDAGFVEVRSMELLLREMVVGERGTRPSFDALGHTGYLTFARKAGD